jgi:hypothetical protein
MVAGPLLKLLLDVFRSIGIIPEKSRVLFQLRETLQDLPYSTAMSGAGETSVLDREK